MGTGRCGGALRGQLRQPEKGVDELAAASAKTALMTVVATALEGRRGAILYHAAAYAQATGNPGPHVVEAAVRKLVREGAEFFLGKLVGNEGSGGR
ncbi:hypothetical protein HYW67_03130 [Candidatus Parcubacteria bacterium]|nr:hypothetical protein [Candidatus Parcubacteria bacterium]